MRKYFIFALAFLSFLPVKTQATEKEAEKVQIDIWNPAKVDWWVSMDDSDMSASKACEIHWLYDDHLDVLLSLSDDNKLFFTFKVTPKNKGVKPVLTLKEGMARKASLVIDDVKHTLGVTDVNLPPVTVIMGISSALNDLSYIQDAERLLLNINNVIYNFPLENMDENMAYFKKCIGSLGKEIKIEPDLSKLEVSPDNLGSESNVLPYDNAVTVEPLSEETPIEGITALPEDKEIAEEEVTKVLGKQKDAMLDDVQYDGVEEHKKSSSKKKVDEKSCKTEDAYDEQGTAIIHNLMRKLDILEREKEELRTKLLATSTSGTIPEIMDCGTQSLEVIDDSIHDDIVAKFEATIGELRAENELLKEALDQAEESTEQQGEVSELKAQIDDLVKKNYELQDKLFNYELDSVKELEKSETSEENEVSEPKTNIIDEIIKDNNLVDIVPKNPETMNQQPRANKEAEVKAAEEPVEKTKESVTPEVTE